MMLIPNTTTASQDYDTSYKMATICTEF